MLKEFFPAGMTLPEYLVARESQRTERQQARAAWVNTNRAEETRAQAVHRRVRKEMKSDDV